MRGAYFNTRVAVLPGDNISFWPPEVGGPSLGFLWAYLPSEIQRSEASSEGALVHANKTPTSPCTSLAAAPFALRFVKRQTKWSMKWRYLKRPDTKASPTSNDSGNEPNSMLLFLLLVSEPTESVSSGAGRGLVGVCISYLVYYLRWPSAELNVSLLMSQRMDV